MGWRRLTITALVAVQCALMAAILPLPRTLKRRQAQRLAKLAPQEALRQLRLLDEVPPEYLPALVGLLGHENDQLVVGVRRRLVNALYKWRESPVEKFESHVNVLASELSEQVSSFRVLGKRQALVIAEAIMNWPLPLGDKGMSVVDHARNVMSQTRHLWRRETPLELALANTGTSPLLTPNDAVAEVPGGGVPVMPSELPDEARQLAMEPLPTRNSREPRLLDRLPAPLVEQPNELPDGPARRIPAYDGQRSRAMPPNVPRLVPEATDPLGFAPDAPVIRLVQALNTRREKSYRRVVELLRARGFSEAQLRLASRLHSADPVERLQLVSELPSARGINPIPWLLLLAEDRDPRVRAAAISTVATSQRQSVLDQLLRLERIERDPDVLARIRDAINRRR